MKRKQRTKTSFFLKQGTMFWIVGVTPVAFWSSCYDSLESDRKKNRVQIPGKESPSNCSYRQLKTPGVNNLASLYSTMHGYDAAAMLDLANSLGFTHFSRNCSRLGNVFSDVHHQQSKESKLHIQLKVPLKAVAGERFVSRIQ